MPPGGRPWHVLVTHGAGSTLETAQALFCPFLEAVVPGRISWDGIDDRTGDVEVVAERIRQWLAQSRSPEVSRVVCGISLGAHAAVLAIGREPRPTAVPDGCIAALPAWIGEPDATAAHTAETGRRIATHGYQRVLADIVERTSQKHRWIVRALEQDWSRYSTSELTASLRTAAGGRAPTLADVRSITAPTLVIGARDDQLHPIDIARSWADVLPDSQLMEIDFLSTRGFVSPKTLTAGVQFAQRLGQRWRIPQGESDWIGSSSTSDWSSRSGS